MEREEDMNDEEESDQETSSIHDTDKMDFSNMSLEDCIKFYALSTNQSHIAINLLSNILSANLGRSLPKSARTLLKTRRNNDDVHNIPGGQLWYYGVAQNIRNYYRSSVPNITTLSINISIDGLPLYKSSRTQFWPILMDIVELENAPVMTVGIFCGQSKPTNVQDYLRKLVDELKDILINGILINSAQIKINLRAIIADAPARAFIKGCAYFNATHGCMKCTCEGEFRPLSNTTTFKSINAPLRTDKEFRAGAYPDHVKVISPLLEIPDIDIIRDVIISESLHLFYLGILKRLLFGWRDGKLGKCYKWSGMQCDSVSEHLVGIELPSEIHRRFRRLDELKNWKGTELASFLHYAGLVVLKVLPSEAYEHFLLLFCAVTMLSSNEFKKNWHVAGKMLETFVIQYGQIYGEQYLTSNVHNLLHVLD
uniref:Transposase domain-containing protein n=1 Tax=Anopheles quadriannulatus TaxID=34691 RepID=A0A182XQ09_ANOQN